MKKFLRFKVCLTVILLFIKNLVSGQCLTPYSAPVEGLLPATYESKNGWKLPASGTFRILTIYIEIDYTGSQWTDPFPGGSSGWPSGQMPTWKDNLLDPQISAAPQGELTRYFKQASFGNFNVLGDYVVNPANPNACITMPAVSYSLDEAGAISYINNLLGNNLSTNSGLNSIADFDLWSTTSDGLPKITVEKSIPKEKPLKFFSRVAAMF